MLTPPEPASFFEQFCRPFRQATGLPLQFHRPGEFSLGDPLVPSFCRVMAQRSQACARCLETHLSLQDPAGRNARTGTCFAGLTSSAVPVCKGKVLLGYLHTGHARVERPPHCRGPQASCALPGRKGLPCSGACRKTPAVSRERYEGALDLTHLLASQIGSLYELPAEGKPYPAVDRVVDLLRADPGRRWTLTDLARQAGMHPGYFSEKFHERTGQTLTQALAALRVERARELLNYSGLAISEIAFASGFRSLSQFNRVYKSVTGHAPSAERKSQRKTDQVPRGPSTR